MSLVFSLPTLQNSPHFSFSPNTIDTQTPKSESSEPSKYPPIIDCSVNFTHSAFQSETTLDRILDNAREKNIQAVIQTNLTPHNTQTQLLNAEKFGFPIFQTIGTDPVTLRSLNPKDTFRDIVQVLRFNKDLIVAIHAGLNLKESLSGDVETKEKQIRAFTHLANFAKTAKLPLSLNIRGFHFDALNILEDFPGVALFHDFSGTKDNLLRLLDMGHFVSVNARILEKESYLVSEVLPLIPLDRLVLESGSPRFSPSGPRRLNEPASLQLVLSSLAVNYKMDKWELAHRFYENTLDLFPRIRKQTVIDKKNKLVSINTPYIKPLTKNWENIEKFPVIDTCAHLEDQLIRSVENIRAIVKEAKESNIKAMLCVTPSLRVSATFLRKAEVFDFPIFSTVGTSPRAATTWNGQHSVEVMREIIQAGGDRIAAIGEIGLSKRFAYNSSLNDQVSAFSHQLSVQQEFGIPPYFRVDGYWDIFFDIVQHHPKCAGGSIMAFSGNVDQLKRALDLGLYISVNNLASFPRSLICQLLRVIPLESLLISSDTPFYALHWKKPQRDPKTDERQAVTSSPKDLPFLLNHIAYVLKKDPLEVSEILFHNSLRAFPNMTKYLIKEPTDKETKTDADKISPESSFLKPKFSIPGRIHIYKGPQPPVPNTPRRPSK